MNSLILCEGKTDAILISYYLKSIYQWEVCAKLPYEEFNFKGLANNQSAFWYKKGSNHLLIFGVGGKDNFSDVIDKYVSKVLKEYPPEKSFRKIAIISDKDENTAENILERYKEYFKGIIDKIETNQWGDNVFKNSFGEKTKLQILPIIIPVDKQGALETVLLDAISEDTYNKVIVNMCVSFIDNIRPSASRYISTDRLALKARLSAVFAVMSPEKVFDFIDGLILSVEWEKSCVLKECFGKLCDI